MSEYWSSIILTVIGVGFMSLCVTILIVYTLVAAAGVLS